MNITKEILEDIIKNSNSLKEIYVKLNFSETAKASPKKFTTLCNHFNIINPYKNKRIIKKRSPIWIIELNVLKEIIKNSFTYTEVLIKMGFTTTNGRISDILKERILKENISVEHFNSGINSSYNNKKNEELFIKNGSKNRISLKKRILNQKLKENICEICKQPPFWNGKPMVLILDHINGISNDNRLENLRLVCPNCNSQLETTNGKNVNKKTKKERIIKAKKITLFDFLVKDKYIFHINKIPLIKTISILNKPIIEKQQIILNKHMTEKQQIILNKKEKNNLCNCGNIKIASSKLCRECYSISRQTKERPSIEELKKELIEIGSYVKIGKKYGVSDNTIRKWLKEEIDIRIEKWKDTIKKVKEDSLTENILSSSYKYSGFIYTLKRNIRNKKLNEEQEKILKDLNLEKKLYTTEK